MIEKEIETAVLIEESTAPANELIHIVESSGLEKTKGEKLLSMFSPFFKRMGEIELKINSLNSENPLTSNSLPTRGKGC